LPVNIWQWLKRMVVSNTLAYYGMATITVIKCFIPYVQALTANNRPSSQYLQTTNTLAYYDTAVKLFLFLTPRSPDELLQCLKQKMLLNHYSLLRYVNNYSSKKFYISDPMEPWDLYHKTYYSHNLRFP
jgi:hypothetical protein